MYYVFLSCLLWYFRFFRLFFSCQYWFYFQSEAGGRTLQRKCNSTKNLYKVQTLFYIWFLIEIFQYFSSFVSKFAVILLRSSECWSTVILSLSWCNLDILIVEPFWNNTAFRGSLTKNSRVMISINTLDITWFYFNVICIMFLKVK